MIDRRAFSFLLLSGAAGLSACAGGPDPQDANTYGGGVDMLFISPMGEPFRAKAPAPYPVVDWFKQADKNGDGKLDLAEFLADADRFFHKLDVNKDGVIDHREIYYYEHVTCPEIIGQAFGALRRRPHRPFQQGDAPKLWLAQFSGGGGGVGGIDPSGAQISATPPPAGGAPRQGSSMVGGAVYNLLADPEPVQGSDIRLTGLITESDFKLRATQRFKILDDQNRGYLTLDSLPETEAQKAVPHPRRGGRGGHGGSAQQA